MRTIGILGGCSAESTAVYYARLNELAQERLPGHGAKLLIHSFDRGEIETMISAGDWDGAARIFAGAAKNLERAGADAVLIATNTMHKVAGEIAAPLDIPLIHIVDETAHALKRQGRGRPLLIGTRYVMDDPFYADALRDNGLDPLAPDPSQRRELHRIIYEELMLGKCERASKRFLESLAERAQGEGADSVILACTELGRLAAHARLTVPVLDTLEIHVRAAHENAFRDSAL